MPIIKIIIKLIGILIMPKFISARGKVIIIISTIRKKVIPAIKSNIIKKTTPRILGKNFIKTTIKAMRNTNIAKNSPTSIIPVVNCVKSTDSIANIPHIIEIERKFLTRAGSVNGPLAKINLGNVKADFL
jgi:hypothetical protein